MEIKATTGIYGIFGHPVSQSLSPAMHNGAFSLLGMDCVYLAFDVDPRDVGAAVDSVRALGVRGVNVTVPHKRSVMAHLDEISPEASLAGAVNTVANESGKLTGHNTDVSGLLRALSSELGFGPRGKNVFLVGAGGAARAAVAGMCAGGARGVAVVNRTPARAEELCGEFSSRFSEIAFAAGALGDSGRTAEMIREADIVINASCAGMGDYGPLSLPLDLLAKRSPVYDLVYEPLETPLVRDARALGLRAESGLGMLLYQGADAFSIWTGRDAPVEAMREILLSSR